MSFKIELDHIGIATPSLEGNSFFKLLGLGDAGTEEVVTEKVKVGFFDTDNSARIELLKPTSEDSPIAKFMDKRGPGIHHICFRVQGIEDIAKRLKEAGVQLINEEPRMGAHHCKVVFIHPKSTGGVLVELSEKVSHE
ncbi:MAG: methylmalonyl-CoA epimerase [Bdellovibrionales bacterium]|nr:methylmalonyl-CoA epimerase [Bdellovibrionales bacterium]